MLDIDSMRLGLGRKSTARNKDWSHPHGEKGRVWSCGERPAHWFCVYARKEKLFLQMAVLVSNSFYLPVNSFSRSLRYLDDSFSLMFFRYIQFPSDICIFLCLTGLFRFSRTEKGKKWRIPSPPSPRQKFVLLTIIIIIIIINYYFGCWGWNSALCSGLCAC